MADDRLDDAIDAVVRAVDRIERATRGQRTLAPEPAAIESELEVDEVEDDDEPAVSPDVLPPATSVSPGRDAWVGAPDARSQHRGGGKKKHKKKHKARPIEPDEPLLADEGDDDNTFPIEQALPEAPPAPLPAGPAFAPPAPPTHAPAEVHELVGRIVARTQELDDHLEASRQLRTEITELVARLAAASTHQR